MYFVKSERAEEYFRGIKVLTAFEFSPDEFDYIGIIEEYYDSFIDYREYEQGNDALKQKI